MASRLRLAILMAAASAAAQGTAGIDNPGAYRHTTENVGDRTAAGIQIELK